MSRWREIGGTNTGCIISLALLVAAVFAGIRIVPTRIAVAELQDYCEREAEQASLPNNGNEAIQEAIYLKSREEHLGVKKEEIQVTRDNGMIHILVRYRVVLDLLVYQYNWDVEHKVERVLF